MLPKLISKVYVISLKSSADRKKHIQQELDGVIDNYEIFEATDKDSEEVKGVMKTDFVKKFPPCFRCSKNKCNCANNVLIKHQIGNWCSLINVMKDIVQNNYKDLIMICEDDIKFTNNGINILNEMIITQNLQKYNVDFQKPILIRVGSGFSQNHTINHKPKFSKEVVMSNPAFICNKYFAESFIKNLKGINTTSDVFIHQRLPNKDKSIQAFTLLPQVIYELSCGKFKKFKSEIHPKGLDEEDRMRAKNHIKRIEYDDYIRQVKGN
tara:strand:+ start:1006 stop:1806 length:801 start_codon:yes stop_codon:yes gene_type:complete